MNQPEPAISPVRCPVPGCHWSVHGIPDAYTTTRATWLAEHQAEQHATAGEPEQAQPEPYTYTDCSDDTLTIGRANNVVTLKAQVGNESADIHVLVEDVEEVVAAIRAAAGQQLADGDRRDRFGQVLRKWGLLDEVNNPDDTEHYTVSDLLTVADEELRELRHYLEGARERSAYFDEEAQQLSDENARLRTELEQARGTAGARLAGDCAALQSTIYDALIACNGVACWDVLRLAQMRQYLTEHLVEALAGRPLPDTTETQPEPAAAEAHPAEHTWAAELHDPLADEWVPGTRYIVRDRAVSHLEHARAIGPTWKDGTPTQRRLVRATTTYTVEADCPLPDTTETSR